MHPNNQQKKQMKRQTETNSARDDTEVIAKNDSKNAQKGKKEDTTQMTETAQLIETTNAIAATETTKTTETTETTERKPRQSQLTLD